MKLKKFLSLFTLLLAALIWGFAFVAQSESADRLPPFTISFLRSLIAAAFLFVIIIIRDLLSKKRLEKAERKKAAKAHIIGGVCCGIALFVASNLQQAGIGLYPQDAAAASRAGFITALYVVLVPVAGLLIFRRPPHFLVWLGVAGAVAGMYLLFFSEGIGSLYIADVVVLLCAVVFCAHILVIDHFGTLDGVKMSCIQFFFVGVVSLICALIFEDIDLVAIKNAILPITYLGIMSSGVAYTLQIVGQKNVEPALASMILSLESVFAAIGGFLFRNELLSTPELLGCGLVFLSIVVAQSADFIKKK
ncbi:MAG: DMT family transporter [Clostridia bacterium]|nr:DMT family transporter [Clostridia bacterium]